MIKQKRIVFSLLLDLFLILVSVYFAFWSIYPGRFYFTSEILITMILITTSYYFFATVFKLYRCVGGGMDLFTIITITKVTTFSFLFNIFIELFIVNYGHEKVIFVSYFFYTMLASVFRLLVPFGNKLTKKPGKIRTMVIGAGIEGMLVVKYLQLSSGTDLKPVVFIDDDPLKQNTILLGIEVIGGKVYLASKKCIKRQSKM